MVNVSEVAHVQKESHAWDQVLPEEEVRFTLKAYIRSVYIYVARLTLLPLPGNRGPTLLV